MGLIDDAVFSQALSELRRRSRLTLYQTDFDAWAWDILRLKSYEKMRLITHDALFASKERTLVKSGNGTGKSVEESKMILWAGSVFPEGETVSIISAPSIPQLQKVTFAYLKSFHGRVSQSLRPTDFQIPGRIDENLGWVSETVNGKIWLASGRKPPDQDAVSMFQGLRSQFGMTYVWFDEAGGMGRAMFTAAEAVMTGELARFFGIGNPDNAGTDFQQNFEDKVKSAEYNLHTISAYDTPTFTGERVYPYTAEGDRLEAQMLKALTSKRWVAHKTRIWATGGIVVPDYDYMDPDNAGEPDPRYFYRVPKETPNPAWNLELLDDAPENLGLTKTIIDPVKWDARGLSKVMGEFPGDNDSAFFPQGVINRSHDRDIEEDQGIRPIVGADIARFGADESVVFINRGGRARVEETWGKTDTVASARKVHAIAQQANAAELRVDASGVGGGVFDMLKNLDEFSDRVYLLIGVDGGTRASDNRRWAQYRSEIYDNLRSMMAGDGMTSYLDLDYDDEELRDQLLAVTFRFNSRGAIQITPKDEMKTEMDGSPDRLDALVYSVLDSAWLTRAADGPQPGDILVTDPEDYLPKRWYDLASGGQYGML